MRRKKKPAGAGTPTSSVMKDITRTSPIIHMRTPIVKGVGDNGGVSR